eukprot:g21893.t1
MPFEPLRYIHAANLNLDTPLTSIGECDSASRDIVENATLTSFERIVSRCVDHNVDFLLLTGNTFDEADRSLPARRALLNGLEQLDANDIRVFVLPGENDPVDAWRAIPELPDNVTVFFDSDNEPVAVIRDDRVIASVSAGTAARFRRSPNDTVTTQTGHWQIGLAGIFDPPELQQQSPALTVDYLALSGDMPRTTIETEFAPAHHPGSAQGLSNDETGPHGCTLVSVDTERRVRIKLLETAAVRWNRIAVAVTEDLHQHELLEMMRDELCSDPPTAAEQLRIVLWSLRGSGALWESLHTEDTCCQLFESLKRSTYSDSQVRWLFRHQLTADQLADSGEPTVPEDSLIAMYARALNSEAAAPSDLINGHPGDPSIDDPRILEFAKRCDVENIAQHARRLGSEWLDESLRELLHDVNANVYSNVFAIGLTELQELATLSGDEVADAIYGVSLAPEGRKLLDAIRFASHRHRELFNRETKKGQLAELLELDRELDSEIRQRLGQRDEYERLTARQRSLTGDIAEMKSRKNGMLSQLKGHRFLDHVWGPWKQVCEYQEALAKLPDASRFPKDGLAQLSKWNEQIDSELRCRNLLRQECSQLKQQIEELPIDLPVRQHAAGIRSLLADQPRMERTFAKHRECETELQHAEDEYRSATTKLDESWTPERLAAIDTSADAQIRLLESARLYQAATVSRGRFRRLYKRLSDRYGKQRARLAGRMKQLSGRSPETALAEARTALAAHHDRSQREHEQRELDHRIELSRKELAIVEPQETMPRWFFWVLIFFAIAGGAVFVTGMITGFTSNALAGLVLALVGLTGVGVTLGLKIQSRGLSRGRLQQLKSELNQLESQRHTTDASSDGDHDTLGDSETTREDASLEQLVQQVSELESLVALEQRQQKRRRRLVELRGRIPRRQQEVSEARHKWCEALKSIGLPENVKIDESFELWQIVCQAVEANHRRQNAEQALQAAASECNEFRKRMEEVGRKLKQPLDPEADLSDVLTTWRERLDAAIAARAERKRLVQEYRIRRKEAARYAKQITECRQHRQTLFAQAGAADEDEFERMAEALNSRAELEELLDIAQQELRDAAATEPDLAVVEDDLRVFDDQRNSECIEMLELEIGEIETDLQAACEKVGGIKQAIETLANDRRLSKLKYEQARVRESIQQQMEEWFGIQLAERGFDAVRTEYERGRQPKVLAAAGRYFEQLTEGQYRNLWTPLGRRTLCIDDDRGRTRMVDQLSGGTREQLFLALRLATIDHLREQGVELPMVLDDVFVNFDENRTGSAIRTLSEYARRGQQVLFFTCHRHIADRFAEQGGSLINLPELAARQQERLAG